MRDLDETDLEILELLMSDARRPWSEIAEQVDLSAPAVSDRVRRLQEVGIIRQFTLNIDHTQLREGVPVLLTIEVPTVRFDSVWEALREAEVVEYLFRTAENDILCYARVLEGDVPSWLSETLEEWVTTVEYEVTLLTESEWTPSLGLTEFSLNCAECGNTVTSEGVADRFNGELYQFCCRSCLARFEETYERIEEGT